MDDARWHASLGEDPVNGPARRDSLLEGDARLAVQLPRRSAGLGGEAVQGWDNQNPLAFDERDPFRWCESTNFIQYKHDKYEQ